MEPRRADRPPLIYNLRVEDRDSGRTLGYVANVSDNGLMLVSNDPIDDGAEYSIVLTTPRNAAGGQRLEFDATIRWCRPRRAGHYSIGVQLLRVDEKSAATLHDLVVRFEQSEPDDGSDPYMRDLDLDSLDLD